MTKEEKTCLISVSGTGYVETEVNIMQISIKVSKVEKTIKLAQEGVNIIVNKLMAILKKHNINERDIHTTSLEFHRHEEYEDKKYVYKGQKASQRILIFITDLKKNMDKAVHVLDNIANNDCIDISIDFKIKEGRENALKRRELAFLDALEKAKKYAEWANLKIIKAVKISETKTFESYEREECFSDRSSVSICATDCSETNIQLGKIENSMTVYVDFLAK